HRDLPSFPTRRSSDLNSMLKGRYLPIHLGDGRNQDRSALRFDLFDHGGSYWGYCIAKIVFAYLIRKNAIGNFSIPGYWIYDLPFGGLVFKGATFYGKY